jgi:two-component system LytT family response regulator
MKLSCLIVDDEEIVARGIHDFAGQVPYLQPIHLCFSAFEAIKIMSEHPVDIIFTDIQMPKLSGIGFLKSLSRRPLAVIITAFPDYALDGFELDVIDYILKPFSFERFLKACNKSRDYFELQSNSSAKGGDYIFVKTDNRIEKIMIDDILFIEALENFVSIHTAARKYITLVSIGGMEDYLKDRNFVRVQKSFLVSASKIDGIEGNRLCIGSHRIPVSRHLKDEVVQRILSDRLLRRK